MMMSTSNRDEPLSFTHPSSSSSPISLSDSYLQDATTSSRSASGSFQNDALLGAFDGGSSSDAEFNFTRSDFRQHKLAGTVDLYDRHVFLCYKKPKAWPPRIEAAEFDRLPRLLSAAVVARKSDMGKETRLTICEGHDGIETSNGDVLIFPDMIRYRRLTHFDVDTFVEEVLVKEGEWMPGTPEKLKGPYVFVCSHGSRDRRCGVCGPALVTRFKEEIESHGLQGKVSVSPCSHIGGHKYAGNVIIFGSNVDGKVTGHWYGYVTPDDVPMLLEQHILKGEVIDLLWRGQMGLSEEAQMRSQELRLQMNGGIHVDKNTKEESTQTQPEMKKAALCNAQGEITDCCQENGKSCCQNSTLPEYLGYGATHGREAKVSAENRITKKQLSRNNSLRGPRAHKVCTMPTYFETWEREDTYAALSVICAALSVGVAYTCYKQLR